MAGTNSSDLPPGFRFHPTDEELIMFYLRNQAVSKPCPVSIIPEVDIYKFDPWELPEKTEFSENEWYFFTPRDRKYPNGVRPNRAAVSGYWKATGTDKSIYSGPKYVGVKKALVFYQGKPPKGVKTDWIMHEYRLSESSKPNPNKQHSGSMRLDDWVLCRIYKKKNLGRSLEIKEEDQIISCNDVDVDRDQSVANATQQVSQNPLKIPRICSLSHLWEMDQFMNAPTTMSVPQLFGEQNSYYYSENNQNNVVLNPNNNVHVNHVSSAPYHGQSSEGGLLMMMNPVYQNVNPVFEFQS